jgi:hypothetical protein
MSSVRERNLLVKFLSSDGGVGDRERTNREERMSILVKRTMHRRQSNTGICGTDAEWDCETVCSH